MSRPFNARCRITSVIAMALLAAAVSVRAAVPGDMLTPAQLSWMRGVARSQRPGSWPALNDSQAAFLAQRAATFETNFESCCLCVGHKPGYMVVDAIWSGPNRQPPVAKWDDVGDSAAWTGHYLAAMAYKYNVTQDAATLQKINSTLDAFDFLTVASGKVGFLVRFAARSDIPQYKAYWHGSNHAFTCPPPYENYTWMGSLSRDMYIGFALGMTATYVAVDVPEIRQRVMFLSERLIDRLSEDTWFIDSPHKGSLPINPTPGFIAMFMRMAMSMNPAKYVPKWGGKPYGVWLGLALEFGLTQTSKYEGGYYSNHLTIEVLYILNLLETSQEWQPKIAAKILEFSVTNGANHLQADFSAFYLASGGSPSATGADSDTAVGVMQGCLLDFFSPPKMERFVNLTANPAYLPHHSADYAVYALLPRDRPGDVYLWQRSPVKLVGGSNNNEQYQSVDFFLPYWMGRASGTIPAATSPDGRVAP